MAQDTFLSLKNDWQAAANGPGDAAFCDQNSSFNWVVGKPNSMPDQENYGLIQDAGENLFVTLKANETLYLRGKGKVGGMADNPAVQA